MPNYQILFILTLIIILSTVTISTTYAQPSDYVQSPKKQLDSGTMPHNIVCRDDLLLVDRGMDKIACVSEKTAQKLGWSVLTNTQHTEIKYPAVNTSRETNANDGKITITSGSHQSFINLVSPFISLEVSRDIKINETSIINYTVDWLDEDGTPQYAVPDGRPHRIDENGNIRYLDIHGNDVMVVPKIILHSEFIMLTDSFKPKSIAASPHIRYLKVVYHGEPIFFTNETVHGSIKFQLTRPLVHTDSIFSVGVHDVGLDLQLTPTEHGVKAISNTDPEFRVSSYRDTTQYFGLSFNHTTQKWFSGDREFETLPSGLPDYIPKPQPVQQFTPPPNVVKEPGYVPQPGWEGLAEFLRSVEKNEGIQITKNWLMDENLSEDFVDDFFNAYPEFSTQNTIFNDFFLPKVTAAAPLQFYVYGYYNTINEDLNHVPADDYLICAFDVNIHNNSDMTILKSGDRDVCTRSYSNGFFKLIGINEDPNPGGGYMDLLIGVSLVNDAVKIINNNKPVEFYESLANIRYGIQDRIIYVGTVNQYPMNYPITHQMYADVTSMHDLLYSKVSYDAPTVNVTLNDIRPASYLNATIYIPYVLNYNITAVLPHEYAHHIQDQIYINLNSEIPICRGHNIDSHYTDKCGWVEGWAWFFTIWMRDSPILYPGFYVDPIDFEYATFNAGTTTEYPFSDRFNITGSKYESWVAASLWDIYDDANEINDTLSTESQLWRAFKYDNSSTIFDFENNWNNLGYPSLGLNFHHNNIRYYVDKTNPQIEITHPSHRSTFQSKNIVINGTSSDNINVTSITIFVNDVLNSNLTNNLHIWSTTISLSRSTNTVTAMAEDAQGNIARDFIYLYHDDDDGHYIIKEITKLAEILWNSNSPWTDESVINQYGVMDEVLEASDCDNECELVTIQSMNLTEYDNANLNLWYYLSSRIDAYQNEGLRIEVSNVSNSWHEIAFFDDVNTDSFTWTEMNMNLDEYSSSENFNVRVTAISSKSDEIIRINDANITGTETIEIKIKSKNVTIFQDHADTFQEWDRSGEDWLITNTTNQNNVDDTVFHAVDCDQDCILVMKNGLNMTPYEKVHLNFSYRMTNVDDYNDEGLKIEANDGNGSWQQVANYTERHNNEERFGIEWSSDNIDIGKYIYSDSLTLRFTVASDSHNEHVYLNDIHIYGDLKINYETKFIIPTISNSNTNNLYAKTGDNITATMNVTGPISNITAMILDRNATILIQNGSISAVQTVMTEDTNGPVSFTIMANAPGNKILLATHDNLTSANIIVDTVKPIIDIIGDNPVTQVHNSFYFDLGCSVSDANNPSYASIVTSNHTLIDTSKLGNQTIQCSADADQAGNIPENKTRTVTVFDPVPYAITLFSATSNGQNHAYAKTGDDVTLELQTNRLIYGAEMTVLNKTILPIINNNTLTATFTIHENHTNGNLTFAISLIDILSRLKISEHDLTDTNVYVDTIAPNLTLIGMPIVHIEIGQEYVDPGALLSDNDPSYKGNITSNATDVSTSVPDIHIIEYTADADLAGNQAPIITRIVNVTGEEPITITESISYSLDIYSSNPNVHRARADDIITVVLHAGMEINLVTATILDKNASISSNVTSIIASIPVWWNDTNGNTTFEIIVQDGLGNMLNVTESNLISENVFVDTTPPTLHLTGDLNIVIIRGTQYYEQGVEARDNDPTYVGTVTSNANLIDTSKVGTYTIVYHITPDPSGNRGGDNSGNRLVGTTRTVNITGTTNSDPAAMDNPVALGNLRIGGQFAFDPVYNVETVKIGFGTYAITVDWHSSNARITDITDPANPAAISSMVDGTDSFTELQGPRNVDTTRIGTNTYALIASYDDDGLQIINITDPTNPIAVAGITDSTDENPTPFTALDGAFDVDAFEIGDDTFAIIASENDGLQIINITDPTNPTATFAFTGGDPYHVDTVRIGTETFAIVLGSTGWGSNLFINISDPANPFVTLIINANPFYYVYFPYHFNTNDIVQNDGRTFSVISSTYYNKVYIIEITNPTAPSVLSSPRDSFERHPTIFESLQAPMGVDIVKSGQLVYALVASHEDDGVQILNITDPSNPTPAAGIRDGYGGFVSTGLATSVSAVQINSDLYAVIGSNGEGIQTVSLGPSANPISSQGGTPAHGDKSYESMLDSIRVAAANFKDPKHEQGLIIKSNNPNYEYANAGDLLTIRWVLGEDIADASATIMGRDANVVFTENIVYASASVLAGDAGHATFAITAVDSAGRTVFAIESDLDSPNVFVDMDAPTIQLDGNLTARIPAGSEYTDAGASVHDNDPTYQGTTRENSTALSTLQPGMYFIEYIAPPDAAGNMPESKIRTIIIYDDT